MTQKKTWGQIAPPPRGPIDDFGDDAGADRLAAMLDSKLEALVAAAFE